MEYLISIRPSPPLGKYSPIDLIAGYTFGDRWEWSVNTPLGWFSLAFGFARSPKAAERKARRAVKRLSQQRIADRQAYEFTITEKD